MGVLKQWLFSRLYSSSKTIPKNKQADTNEERNTEENNRTKLARRGKGTQPVEKLNRPTSRSSFRLGKQHASFATRTTDEPGRCCLSVSCDVADSFAGLDLPRDDREERWRIPGEYENYNARNNLTRRPRGQRGSFTAWRTLRTLRRSEPERSTGPTESNGGARNTYHASEEWKYWRKTVDNNDE